MNTDNNKYSKNNFGPKEVDFGFGDNIEAEFEIDEIVLKGVPCAPGTNIGKAVVLEREKIYVPDSRISKGEINGEINRFGSAIESLRNEFASILNKIGKESANIAPIIETSLMMVEDDYFRKSVEKRIKQGYSAESSLVREIDDKKKFFNRSHDKILRERAVDLDHIKERLLYILRDRCLVYSVSKDSIVIAKSLTPADIVNFKEAGVIGIVTEVGGIASHAAILARSFEIPMVMGVKNSTELIKNGAEIIVDGFSGKLISNPTEGSITLYKEKKSKEQAHRRQLGKLVKEPSVTLDGKKVKLLANVDFLEDVEASIMVGAEGVGLVRTENLIFGSNFVPSEREQYKWYRELADRCYPHAVTLRAFDLGSDKYAEGMPFHEDNPALGYRGIRFLLSRPDLFEPQIKAILRASVNRNVRLMLPMVSTIRETLDAREIIEKCKEDLHRRKKGFDTNIPIGIMIETPSAALISDKLAEVVDFFSIGTNDLTQYVLAADRDNELVADIFDSFHPSIIRLIRLTVEAAKKNNIPVAICGELAGHSAATALLIGLGIDELSVPPSILLELKSRVRELEYSHALKLVDEVMTYSCQKEVRDLLNV